MAPRRGTACLLFAGLAYGRAAACSSPGWLHLGSPEPLENAHAAFAELEKGRMQGHPGPWSGWTWPREGPLAGEWHFSVSGEGKLEQASYIRISHTAPYRVDVRVFCESGDCGGMTDQFKAMQAPRPTGDALLLESFRKVVATEACDPLLPAAMPTIRTPREALRRGIHGDVQVKIYSNRCGDVRDAELGESSGDKLLDRVALSGVLHWRVPSTGRAGWSSHTIGFHEPTPPINGTDVRSIPSFDDRKVQPRAR